MSWFDILKQFVENTERDTRLPTYKITEINVIEINNIINMIESDSVGYHITDKQFLNSIKSSGLESRNPDAGDNPHAIYATHTEPHLGSFGVLIVIKDVSDADYKGPQHLHWYRKNLPPSKLIFENIDTNMEIIESLKQTYRQGSIDYIDEKIHSLPKEAMDILDKIYKNKKLNHSKLNPFIYSKVAELIKYEIVPPQQETTNDKIKINPFLKKPQGE
tara:strand:+ start:723 stop:1376 length:654 start_codon:yes stop_codon:yes gene_type:complete